MKFKEFQLLLEEKLSSYELFITKATEYQNEKNKNRPPKKRWDEAKVERAVEGMWKQLAENVYNKVKPDAPVYAANIEEAWDKYMEEKEMYGSLNDTIDELEFD